jgi:hypothetical protein
LQPNTLNFLARILLNLHTFKVKTNTFATPLSTPSSRNFLSHQPSECANCPLNLGRDLLSIRVKIGLNALHRKHHCVLKTRVNQARLDPSSRRGSKRGLKWNRFQLSSAIGIHRDCEKMFIEV